MRFKVNVLLAGILVMTMLYSVNLRVMGGRNLPVPRVVAEKSTQSFEEMSGGTGLDDLFGELEVKTQERALKTGSVVKNIFNNAAHNLIAIEAHHLLEWRVASNDSAVFVNRKQADVDRFYAESGMPERHRPGAPV